MVTAPLEDGAGHGARSGRSRRAAECPSAVSCRLSCPTWHHNAASIPNNTSGFLCSSLLVVSGFIPRSPQRSLALGSAVFR